jgi:hypothetical protein
MIVGFQYLQSSKGSHDFKEPSMEQNEHEGIITDKCITFLKVMAITSQVDH